MPSAGTEALRCRTPQTYITTNRAAGIGISGAAERTIVLVTGTAADSRSSGVAVSILTKLEPGQAGPRIDRQADAYQHCMVGIRKFWSADLYRQVLREIRANRTESEIDAATPGELERDSLKDTTYQYFAWLEHQLQQYKYLGRYGIVTEIAKQAPQLTELLDSAASRSPELLHLNPNIVLPAYYTKGDFHQHPGGIWSDDYDAFAYEMAARISGQVYPTQDSAATAYHNLARICEERFHPNKVLDVGCGFGLSTLPFKSDTAAAQVVGCDLSAPALRLAHLRALEAGLEIDFRQERAEELASFQDDSFDLVTSVALFHEIPQKATREFLRAAHRVLEPGGTLATADLYRQPGGPLAHMFYLGSCSRNREPFMRSFIGLDMAAELEDAGFSNIAVEWFDTATTGTGRPEGINENTHSNGWSLIVATK
jgi:ubiquinone/menaquinone biosynthesis C-methylase UbiE